MRRRAESAWLGGACAVVLGAAGLLGAAQPAAAGRLALFVGAYLVGLWLVHAALARWRPEADEYLWPLVALIAGLGLLTLFRVRPGTAWRQLAWTGFGMAGAAGFAAWFGNYRRLAGYRYLAGVAGLVLTAVTLVFGRSAGGARAWLALGPLHFEPSEVGKILLVLFLSGYLDETKEVLTVPGSAGPGQRWAKLRHLGPALLFWAVAMLLLIAQNDLGAAVLVFAIFLVMLYVATGRPGYVVSGAFLAGLGGIAAYRWVSHVRIRVASWLNPWADFHGWGYQAATATFALAAGGLTGRGIGLGHPELVPAVTTDFALVAWAEEWGLLGIVGLVAAFAVLVARGLQLALAAPDDYGLLLGTGLTAILAVQGVTILGGVMRVIPLTGITMPFFGYGGTAAVTNFLIIGLLWTVSSGRGAAYELPYG